MRGGSNRTQATAICAHHIFHAGDDPPHPPWERKGEVRDTREASVGPPVRSKAEESSELIQLVRVCLYVGSELMQMQIKIRYWNKTTIQLPLSPYNNNPYIWKLTPAGMVNNVCVMM